ncbi:hypothetical protein ACFQZC_32285 [Streptacidiphilus monticola]
MEKPASPTLTAARAVTGAARVPQRRRRRPAVLALAVALVASGGLGGAALYLTTGQRVAVLALARDVPAGQQVEPADLVQVRISSTPRSRRSPPTARSSACAPPPTSSRERC